MDQLPPLRAGRPASPDLLRRRSAGEALGSQAVRDEVATVFEPRGGVPCVICTPPDARGAIVHFHGGGYRMGSARAWLPFGTRLAAASRLEVVIPDYRLAPEHPFPAGLHDACAVVEACAAAPGLLISGDSAGGGLALASTLIRGERAAGVVLLSPWLDLTLRAATFQTQAATDQLFSLKAAEEAAEGYLQGASADHPMASPLLADVTQAPPALIMVSTSEVLLGDSLDLASRLALAGRDVTLQAVPGEPHVWPVLAPDRPASRRALSAIAAFTDRVLGSAG